MRFIGAAIAFLAFGAGASSQAAKRPVKDIMDRSHKGKDALIFRVRDGDASDEDKKKLLAEYAALNRLDPPTGDKKAWKGRTAAAVAALTDLVEKKNGALDRVVGATGCKSCHDAHRVGGNSGK